SRTVLRLRSSRLNASNRSSELSRLWCRRKTLGSTSFSIKFDSAKKYLAKQSACGIYLSVMAPKSADVKRFILVSVLLVWCVSLIAVRIDRTGSGYYRFLITNLVLACVPLFLSTILRIASHWRLHWTIQGVCLSLWLLFLPNAPYILTDILHLTR